MKKYVAEMIGTFVLTLLGCGTAMFLGCATPAGVVGTAIAFGLTVVAMAYTIGGISGCHINPAITLGVALSGRMSWKDACGYWVGQVIGGILAGLVLFALVNVVTPNALECTFGVNIAENMNGLGCNGVANAGGPWGACLVEVIATFIFVLVVLGTTDEKLGAGNLAGLAIGLTLILVHLVCINLTGTSVNPARSIGPALFAGGQALCDLWVFICAPLVGAALAALVWKGLKCEKE
ncbi:MAG: aquaporin [Bacteroidales bacterium]|nr:aquaporin [Bacteroidales bacterium]